MNLDTNVQKTSGLILLKAIQGWVDSFFGCLHCKNHFMTMTTNTFKMNKVSILMLGLNFILFLFLISEENRTFIFNFLLNLLNLTPENLIKELFFL